MQNCRKPLFTKGRVLKKESLDCLTEYPRELTELIYSRYSDGVLHGCEITYKEGVVHISSGVIKYGKEVILLKEETITFSNYDRLVSVKICIGKKYLTEDYEIIPIEIRVDQKLELEKTEMEIGRFCLTRGAALRINYKDVEDFQTAYNTLDLTQVMYAGIEKPSITPKLLKIFAETLLKSNTNSVLDITFVLQCLNSERVQRDCILWYLSKRLEEPYVELTNEEIYKSLVRIVKNGIVVQETRVLGNRRGPSIM